VAASEDSHCPLVLAESLAPGPVAGASFPPKWLGACSLAVGNWGSGRVRAGLYPWVVAENFLLGRDQVLGVAVHRPGTVKNAATSLAW